MFEGVQQWTMFEGVQLSSAEDQEGERLQFEFESRQLTCYQMQYGSQGCVLSDVSNENLYQSVATGLFLAQTH